MICSAASRLGLATLGVVVLTVGLFAQPPVEEAHKAKITAHWKAFDREITMKAFPENSTFGQVLQVLSQQFPPDHKIAIHFDAAAFGANFADAHKTPIMFPAFLGKMPSRAVLGMALSQVKELDRWECVMDPMGKLTITTPARSLTTQSYDLREILRVKDNWLSDPRADPVAFIVHVLCGSNRPEEWQNGLNSMRIDNGNTLIVRATPSAHDEIAAFIAAILRLSDVAVVMNAKLYELDAANFETFAAAAKAPEKKAGETGWLFHTSERQLKHLNSLTAIGQSDPVKLRPGRPSVFLSRQWAVAYLAEPLHLNPNATLMSGASFSALPIVTPDRRSIELLVTQDHVRVELKKVKANVMGDAPLVDEATIRRSSAMESIKVDDGQSLGFIVQQPLPKDVPAGRRWVMVMTPTIYIEEEQRQLKVIEKEK